MLRLESLWHGVGPAGWARRDWRGRYGAALPSGRQVGFDFGLRRVTIEGDTVRVHGEAGYGNDLATCELRFVAGAHARGACSGPWREMDIVFDDRRQPTYVDGRFTQVVHGGETRTFWFFAVHGAAEDAQRRGLFEALEED